MLTVLVKREVKVFEMSSTRQTVRWFWGSFYDSTAALY